MNVGRPSFSSNVGDFYGAAKTVFSHMPGGASGQAVNAQNKCPSSFKQQGLNLETAHKAGKVESDHMLKACSNKAPMSTADKIALAASVGGGFAPRNLASRFVGGLSQDAYKGNNPREQAVLNMHKRNLIDNPHY